MLVNMLGMFSLHFVIKADSLALNLKRVKRMSFQKEHYELSGPKLDKAVRPKDLKCRYLDLPLEQSRQKQRWTMKRVRMNSIHRNLRRFICLNLLVSRYWSLIRCMGSPIPSLQCLGVMNSLCLRMRICRDTSILSISKCNTEVRPCRHP